MNDEKRCSWVWQIMAEQVYEEQNTTFGRECQKTRGTSLAIGLPSAS